MKSIRFGLLGLSMSLAAGCATGIELQYVKAPEINLSQVKTIKIMPFEVSGELDLDYMNSGNGLGCDLTRTALDAGVDKITENLRSEIQRTELEAMKHAVVQNGFYRITGGQDFDAQVSGNIHYKVTDKGQAVDEKDRKGKITSSYRIRRTAEVEVAFSVIQKDGAVLGSSTVSGSAEEAGEGDDREKAGRNTAEWQTLVERVLAEQRNAVVCKISPCRVREIMNLEEGGSSYIREGNQAAKNSHWEVAVQFWNQGLSSALPKDRFAALYNLAVYDELEGRLKDALARLEKVCEISGDLKYERDLERLRARIDDQEKLGAK